MPMRQGNEMMYQPLMEDRRDIESILSLIRDGSYVLPDVKVCYNSTFVEAALLNLPNSPIIGVENSEAAVEIALGYTLVENLRAFYNNEFEVTSFALDIRKAYFRDLSPCHQNHFEGYTPSFYISRYTGDVPENDLIFNILCGI